MAWDKTWDSLFASRPWGKYPGEDVIRFVARHFYKATDRQQIRLLEVGCGTGANIWYMAREGFDVYGVDGSEQAIGICQRRLDTEVNGWKGQLFCADMTALKFSDNYFDAVLDIEACCCNSFEDAQKIYAEMVRVLKPGGKLYSRCFAKGTYGDETGKPMGHNAYITDVGAMAGTGLTRFTSRDDIDRLLPINLSITELDQIQRGILTGNLIIEWCITGEKHV